jgi:hydroxymethylbilane synthase
MRLVLAARRSELARIQALQVGHALEQANPQLTIEYSFHESLGDRNQNDPLWQMPEKGVFTQDLREGLIAGRYDLAVHSWKDLAIEDDGTTEIAATLPRADMRDLLLIRADRWSEIARTGRLKILTSSPRRSFNLDSFLPRALPAKIGELIFEPVRGNVPTRVRKMWEPGADGLIVAKAAIDRLLETDCAEFAETKSALRDVLWKCRWMVLPLRANPAAPAQGALAVEIKSERAELRQLLASINCAATFQAALREREILRGYGGGCHQKIGASVLQRSYGEITFLRGMTDDGILLNATSLAPTRSRPAKISRAQMWPLKTSDADWFKREAIPATIPNAPLWISKADALPHKTSIAPEQLVWASGLRTWERLAGRGIWVNGCAEGLGEQELSRIETLVGADLTWAKLTHDGAPAENGIAARESVVPTYRLVAKDGSPGLDDKKYFFWTSGSSFARALALNPSIKSQVHFSGPGNTQSALEKNGVKPHIFLDHEQWLKEMSL